VKVARDFKPLVHQAQEAGWHLEMLGNGHLRLVAPGGRWVYLSASPSDRRARWKVRAAMRRAGLSC
jgi:hypothetical protein